MNKFSGLSDFEVNKLISVSLGFNVQQVSIVNVGRVDVAVSVFDGVESISKIKDYCNNWADMGPLIVESKICVEHDMIFDGKWHCCDLEEVATAINANPLRAAAEVYLMIKDTEQCKS